ncbi:putative iron (III) dicitrate transport substrate binding protein [Gottschalkia purinilytica]|uniref:Putative iron (III) dicitrate transport substrate binding protein n=1 Tax=Gottschalkia purinilytica TaxID=1503 RepID=A0A0L0WFE3_GOTPU|nr:cobalamin-binding protein [Gottschalkia purinilytica]KNF10140.1 putative iron (III) dicitrate transport substrate binding protein [Gottschalkia purinilytica]
MKNNFKRISILFLILLMVSSLLIACSNNNTNNQEENAGKTEASKGNYPVKIKDDFGNKVSIDKEPQRIVSIAPNHTEILFSLGLDDKIVGVTDYCDYPEEAKSKQKIGGFQDPNIEKIIELNPDLVIQTGIVGEDTYKKLKEAGIAVLTLDPKSIQDVNKTLERVGIATNTKSQAKKIINNINKQKDEVVNKVKNIKNKPKVFYEVWHEPLTTAGIGSFVDEFITLAGGENIGRDAKGEYPQYSVEKLIEKNPDVYILTNHGRSENDLKSVAQLKSISAIKNNKVYVLDDNLVSRAGPRITEGLKLVAESLHPELFK